MELSSLAIASVDISVLKETPIGSIPRNWGVKTLIDVVGGKNNFIIAGPFGSNLKVSDYREKGIPIIRLQNIDNGVFINKDIKYIDSKKAEELSYHSFQKGDLVLAKLGDPIGKTCIVPDHLEKGIVVADVVRIRTEGNSLDKKFIMYALNSTAVRNQLINGTVGSTRPRVNLDDVRNILIPFPPGFEQRKIAAILSSVDASIGETEGVIAKLNHVKNRLFHGLLTRGFDERGILRDLNADHEQFKNIPFLGQIPNAWNALSIGSIAIHIGSGVTPKGGSKVYKKEGILFIRSQNVTFNGLLLDDIAYIDINTHIKMKRSEIFSHDVLLNITGASIGRCCPVPEGIPPANVNQHVCAIRLPNPSREDAILLSSILASPIGQSQIERFNAGGNREGLNYEQLRSFIIPWPPLEERKRIAQFITFQNSRLCIEGAYLNKLKQIKKGLMHDLLTGKVRVKVDNHA